MIQRRALFAINKHCRNFSQSLYKTLDEDAAYCMNMVKEHQFDNYLCGLLWPKSKRNAYFAIRALNIELSQIDGNVRGNPLAGKMRCQWWRDSIGRIYNSSFDPNSTPHPVLNLLNKYCIELQLTERWFTRCLDVRQTDITNCQPPASLDDMEWSIERIVSSMEYLLLESMNIRNEQAEYATSHIGVCSGICNALARTPLDVAEGQRCALPTELLEKHEVGVVDWSANNALTPSNIAIGYPNSAQEATNLSNFIFDIASQAHAHLEKGRECQLAAFAESAGSDPNLHQNLHFVLLPAMRSELFLDKLKRCNFDIFDPSLQLPVAPNKFTFQLQLKLVQCRFTKKI